MNVLFLTIDALRWDVAQTMPWFGKWTREKAVWFKNHYAVAHCSDPNYLSLLSGLHPDSHGVVTQITRSDNQERNVWDNYPAFANIPSWLKKFHGHRCGAYTATYPQFYWYGLDEVTPMGRLEKTKAGWPQVKKFMAGGEPWYFFVRTMDCHAPYRAGGYQQAVRVTDNLMKDLIIHVEENYPDTLIIVCSDHGEALGEHGMNGHWSTLYEVLVRTPMYLSWPGCSGGSIATKFTQHQDLFPTIVELFSGFGKSQSDDFDGWPMLWHTSGEPRGRQLTFVGYGVFHEAYQQHRALLRWPWKYIVSAHIKEGPRFELYNLADDPWEEHDLAALQPDKLQEMAEGLANSNTAARDFVRPDTAGRWDIGLTKEDADEILRRLKELGYA